MHIKNYGTWTIIIILVLFHSQQKTAYTISNEEASRYLHDIGYIESVNIEDNKNLLLRALKFFQANYGLHVSGKLDSATSSLMALPRCGNKDIHNKNISIHQNRESFPKLEKNLRIRRSIRDFQHFWNKKRLSYRVNSYPTNGLSKYKVRVNFLRAFSIWAKETDLDFYEEIEYRNPADIEIEFYKHKHGDAIPFDGQGNIVAHAFFPKSIEMGHSRSGDIHFDDDELWAENGDNHGENLLLVSLHQIGHSLGLDHSLDKQSVMYRFYTSINRTLIKLSAGDIKSIREIYGNPPVGKTISFKNNDTLPQLSDPPTTPITTLPPKTVPDPCFSTVDSIAVIRRAQIYVIQGLWQWRVSWTKTINDWRSYQLTDKPMRLLDFWSGLPTNLDKIDAIFETSNEQIYFFRGRRFWIMRTNIKVLSGFENDGRPITDLGLPQDLNKIDSIFTWNNNGAVYIFSGSVYWKFNETEGPYGQVISVPHYPRPINLVWKGIPSNINAIFSEIRGVTYFIKGNQYYSFNNYQMTVNPGYPKPAQLTWLGCENAELLSPSTLPDLIAQSNRGQIHP